jgi:hypothetical protein
VIHVTVVIISIASTLDGNFGESSGSSYSQMTSMSSFRVIRSMRISAFVRTRPVPPPDHWTRSSNFRGQNFGRSPSLQRSLHGSQSAYVNYLWANLYVNEDDSSSTATWECNKTSTWYWVRRILQKRIVLTYLRFQN